VKDGPDTPAELRARALRLLARREHTRTELERKLAGHAESAPALAEVLDALTLKNQLSERRYAEERIRQLSRKYGAARIRQDLKSKGVSDALIDQLIFQASSEGELERARAILERKYKSPAATREERARRMRFLQSRGFSSEIIFSLLSARGAG
jgi:regulatory protein